MCVMWGVGKRNRKGEVKRDLKGVKVGCGEEGFERTRYAWLGEKAVGGLGWRGEGMEREAVEVYLKGVGVSWREGMKCSRVIVLGWRVHGREGKGRGTEALLGLWTRKRLFQWTFFVFLFF